MDKEMRKLQSAQWNAPEPSEPEPKYHDDYDQEPVYEEEYVYDFDGFIVSEYRIDDYLNEHKRKA